MRSYGVSFEASPPAKKGSEIDGAHRSRMRANKGKITGSHIKEAHGECVRFPIESMPEPEERPYGECCEDSPPTKKGSETAGAHRSRMRAKKGKIAGSHIKEHVARTMS